MIMKSLEQFLRHATSTAPFRFIDDSSRSPGEELYDSIIDFHFFIIVGHKEDNQMLLPLRVSRLGFQQSAWQVSGEFNTISRFIARIQQNMHHALADCNPGDCRLSCIYILLWLCTGVPDGNDRGGGMRQRTVMPQTLSVFMNCWRSFHRADYAMLPFYSSSILQLT